MPAASFTKGRGRVFDGKDTIVGDIEVAGRNVQVTGRFVLDDGSLGAPVKRLYTGRALQIDWEVTS